MIRRGALFLLFAGRSLALSADDGALDLTFGGDGIVAAGFGDGPQWARAVAAFPDGSLLVGGSYGTAGNTSDFYVVRYHPNGGVDGDWGNFGGRLVAIDALTGGEDDLERIVLDPSGAAVLLGTAAATAGAKLPALARLTPEGDLDVDFGTGGIAVGDTFPWGGGNQTNGAAPHLDGFLFAGDCTTCGSGAGPRGYFLYRTDASGAPDGAFGDGGWLGLGGWTAGASAWALETLPDGRILLGATLSNGGTDEVRIYRLLASGAPDPTFGGGDGIATFTPPNTEWHPSSIAADPVDGAVYVGLRYGLEESSIHSGSVARLAGSGEFDATFGYPDLTFDEGSTVEDIVLTSDRRIVAVGRIDGNGTQPGGFFFARLLASGELDDSFAGNGVERIEVDSVVDGRDGGLGLTLSAGRPVAVGYGETHSGGSRFATMRLENALIFRDGFERGSTASW